jgi:hypothetical protein
MIGITCSHILKTFKFIILKNLTELYPQPPLNLSTIWIVDSFWIL